MPSRPWIDASHFEARARLRFIAALVLSALVHALIASGLSSGSAARGGRTISTVFPVQLTVGLAPVPEPPVASPEPEPSRRAAAKVPRVDRRTANAAEPARTASHGAGDERFTGIPDPTYYAARQLDVYPALEGALDLRYPAGAAASNINGRVVLLVLIAANGMVDEAGVVEAEPPGVFDGDAVRALLAARFRPALRNGRAVKSRLVVEVSFGPAQTRGP